MEVVEIDGVGYVKASDAAKRAKYTSDYVGQLCRGEKIPAKLIGRTWYVDLTALLEYKAKKRGDTSDDTPPPPRRTAVRKIENRRFAKTRKSEKTIQSSSEERISYERDFVPVNLNLGGTSSTKRNRSIKVELHEPKRLRIHLGSKKKTIFTASELPSVSLKGKLEVEEYDLPDDESTEEADSVVRPAKSLHRKHDDISKAESSACSASDKKHDKKQKPPRPRRDRDATESPVSSFRPSSVSDAATPLPLLRFAPAIATVVALICVGVILSAQAMVFVDSQESSSRVTVQVANLLQLFD